MFSEQILSFTCRLLSENEIDSFIVSAGEVSAAENTAAAANAVSITDCTDPDGSTAKDFLPDRGLRRTLGQDPASGIRQMLNLLSAGCPDRAILCCTDAFAAEYISIRLPQDGALRRWLIAGPFLYEKPSYRTVSSLCTRNHIPSPLYRYMEHYYAELPVVLDDGSIKNLFRCLGAEIWGGMEVLRFVSRQAETDGHTLDSTAIDYSKADRSTIELLEKRYENERQLMNHIRQGNWENTKEFLKTYEMPRLSPRAHDSLRDLKNGLIILNTLGRKSAEYARVHPLYLDELSGRIAVQIENTASSHALLQMHNEIIRKYCLLVQAHALKQNSHTISRVMNLISFDLTADLSLSALAKEVSLNPCYLSAAFKKETGMTVTAYVNRSRLEHAIFLLNSTDLPIQEIALQCGFEDNNYFIRVFRKSMGTTPGGYRRKLILDR